MESLLTVKIIIISSLLASGVNSNSILSWFWGKTDDKNVLIVDDVPLMSVAYESRTEDEKFLQEASKVTDIRLSSPLEMCQHKVILKIKTSCSTMTEEELAKLSVNLLNCQSAVEGRQIYPCTDDMSLKQCTTDMDADMWNAYHLISNRARAVCYATRSTQFRALTELTVNKLMQSAHSQVNALNSLKENHNTLGEKTLEVLTTITDSNKILLNQQKYIEDAHKTANRLVESHLRELQNEKSLIRTGHAQLSVMTEDIKKKLEKTTQQLSAQSSEQQHNHQELLNDLIKLQRQTELIWDKIESSTNRIIQLNTVAAEKYKQTLSNLNRINKTVNFILNVTDSMRAEFQEKLTWITDYIGDTGEQFHRVYNITMHIIYLLVAMLIAAFLNAPFLTRITIMGLIPLNLLSFLKHGMRACLDFTSITVLIFTITVMHFVMVGIHHVIGTRGKMQVKSSAPTAADHSDQSNYQPKSRVSLIKLIKSSSASLATRLSTFVQDINKFIINTLMYIKEQILALLPLSASYTGNASTTEELSCSYLPVKKHEDVVDSYLDEFPSISEDDECSIMFNKAHRDDSIAGEYEFIRQRPLFRRSPSNTNSYDVSSSRSVSPNSDVGTKILCLATTKTGAKCRSRVQPGRNYCGRHNFY